MSNAVATAIAWIGLALHLVAGIAAARSAGARVFVPLLNLITAGSVVAYWATRWFGYIFRGVAWEVTDQLIPLYAMLVCVLAGLTLAGRFQAVTLNWVAFVLHGALFVVAVLFVTFFRMNRLF